jgi:hypothetical protein
MNTCLILSGHRDRAIGRRNTNALWMVIKRNYLPLVVFNLLFKWQICYPEMTQLLQFAINVFNLLFKWQICYPEMTQLLQFAINVFNLLFKWQICYPEMTQLLHFAINVFNLLFKWQICYPEMTQLLHFAINVRKSHRQPPCTLQLVHENRVLFVWVDFQVSLCRQQHPKCELASRLVYPLFCFLGKLRSSSNPSNKNLTNSGQEILTHQPR